jgi:glycosyltransferase involved in cell wall biosynthesis
MKVLFLAPQPFFVERGTPISVDLLLKVLSKRGEHIDLITYHLGNDVEHENINLNRIMNLPFIRSVPPGLSMQKIICDFFLFIKAVSFVLRDRYDVIHAVEESVFIALLIKKIWGTQYIYDMDSRLPRQLLDRYPVLKPFTSFLYFLERVAVRNAATIVPVCDSLADEIEEFNNGKVIVLYDISLVENGVGVMDENLKEQMDNAGTLVMYVGNLESYQGIDLLLESFPIVNKKSKSIRLAIIGGKDDDILKYKQKSETLGINSHVQFLGPRPVKNLAGYLSEADILVSPRINWDNTPMKIYSFMGSGKPIVATRLITHTQVLDDSTAILVEPNPESFAEGMLLLAEDEDLMQRLGERGKILVEEKYNFENFQTKVNYIYDSFARADAH